MATANAEECSWALSQLAQAVTAVVLEAGLATAKPNEAAASGPAETADIEVFIEWQAKTLGCEAQPVDATYRNLESELKVSFPAVIRISPSRFLALLKVRRGDALVLTPSREIRTLPLAGICDVLRTPFEGQAREQYAQVLHEAKVPVGKHERAINLLLREQFGERRFQDAWILRAPAGLSFPRFLHEANTFRNGSALLLAHAFQYLLWLASWAILGRLSIQGRMDRGWLLAWGLLLMTIVPLRAFTTWLQGLVAIQTGMALKRRLLLGSLKAEPEEVRHFGTGAFLGQAFEAEAVETLALSGGIAGLLAVVEVGVSALVLGRMAILLGLWFALICAAGWKFLRHYQRWTSSRMDMTQELVETMVGNRTRLAQQSPRNWHKREDDGLSDYLGRSQQIDHSAAWLVAALPRGWLICGLLSLAPVAISGASSMTEVAVRLGGVLLAFNAFKKLTTSSVDIAAAIVAGMRILPLFQLASRPERIGQTSPSDPIPNASQPVVEADKVTFRYRKDGSSALHTSSLTIGKGERILLEGPSGGGKSTFASLLSGMRKQDSGLVLIHGLDSHTIGSQRWRKQVAASPQFHDNHILTETLAFNLLMGRSWPPSQSDLREAQSVCCELGLGPLLERMPSGIMQMVGEGGWQLSHGERSRIFIARSLLQNAELVILDESFAALDPENLESALQCTLARTGTLLVIAHP